MKFKNGDVVRLYGSNTRQMTVSGYVGEKVECLYFIKSKLHKKTFTEAFLTKLSTKTKGNKNV